MLLTLATLPTVYEPNTIWLHTAQIPNTCQAAEHTTPSPAEYFKFIWNWAAAGQRPIVSRCPVTPLVLKGSVYSHARQTMDARDKNSGGLRRQTKRGLRRAYHSISFPMFGLPYMG